ncbi:MAG: glycosyltransferase family 1 protein [Lysobacteraceae bacterium]
MGQRVSFQAKLPTFAQDGTQSAAGLRVALFSGNYNYTRDGANKALNKLVGHLLQRGAAVRVYSPTSNNPAFDPAGDLVSVSSVAIPGRSEFRVALGLPKRTAVDVRQFKPNIFHLSAPDWLGTGAQQLAWAMGVPTVASMHTRFETYFEYYGLGTLRSWALRRQRKFYQQCNWVLAPNEPSRSHLVELGVTRERVGIWSRGVEHALFSPAHRDLSWRRALGYADDEVVILFFGRLVREKGTDCFAATVQELRQRGLPVRPLIVGDGPAREEMARRLGDAMFLGHLEGPHLGRAIASADILLNPSLTEAFGNVNLEAMAAELAVVSADVGSASALITDGVDGFLCPPEPAHFARLVAMLSVDPHTRTRVGREAAITAQKYQWPEVLEGVIDAYRDLVRVREYREADPRH